MPSNKYCAYIFSKDSPAEIVAEQLVYDVRKYGMAFMTDHLDLGALVEGMRTSRFAVRFMVAYRIPAGLFLLGRMDEAQEFLKVELDETADRHDPAALRFRAFATKLAELIGRGAS